MKTELLELIMPAKRFSNYQNPLSLIARVLLVVQLRRTRVLVAYRKSFACRAAVPHQSPCRLSQEFCLSCSCAAPESWSLLPRVLLVVQLHDGGSYCSHRAKLLREAAGSRMRGMIKAVSS